MASKKPDNDVLDDRVIPDLRSQGLYPPRDDRLQETPSPSKEHNLFINFKRFIDDGIRALDDGIRQLPSNIAELKEKMQEERRTRMAEERDVELRWVGLDAEKPGDLAASACLEDRHSAANQKAALPWTIQLLRRARDLNKDVPVQKIVQLYRDDHWWSGLGDLDRFAQPMLSLGGACYYLPETGDNLPSTANWRWSTQNYRWLSVEWFKRSPYSPVSLEHHPDLKHEGAKWRAAFEDLLSAALDKPMLSHNQHGMRPPFGAETTTWHGSGLDWMLSLQCRGILPPQLPGMWQHRFGPPIKQSLEALDRDDGGILGHWPRGEFRQLVDEVATPAVLSEDRTVSTQMLMPKSWPRDEQELYEKYPFADNQDDEDEDEDDVEDDDEEYEDDEEVEENEHALRSAWHLPGAGIPSMLKEIEEMERRFAEAKSEMLRDEEEQESMARICPPRSPAEPAVQHSQGTQTVEAQKKADVLSSLTTTQTTRLPDGTVTTKVVLKQRFADGREETHESVQTSNEKLTQAQARQKDEAAEKARKDGGWFWR